MKTFTILPIFFVFSNQNVITNPCSKAPTYSPVCGTNGVTYDSFEELKCVRKRDKIKDLEEYYYGPCYDYDYDEPKKQIILNPCSKAKIYSPVCGTNSITYDSPDELECVRKRDRIDYLEENYNGPCVKGVGERYNLCSMSRAISPVCGSNGITYDSPDELKCVEERDRIKNLKIAYDGPCMKELKPEEIINPCSMTRIDWPVCGSNGVTYDSPDELECVKIRDELIDLYLDSSGRCQ